MEYIGYILFFKSLKLYYGEFGQVGDPFDALFYFDKEKALCVKEELEQEYSDNVDIIKVQKTIKIIKEM
jgi:hypothetical protein